jgi:hypothetical protein
LCLHPIVHRLPFFQESFYPFSAVRVIGAPRQKFTLFFELVFERGVKRIGEKLF